MNRISRTMPLGVALTALTLALAGCGQHDPQTYALSIADAKKALMAGQSSYEAGNQMRFMKATGSSANGLGVRLWNDVSWEASCELHLTAIDDAHTKIVPVCGSTESAIGSTTIAMVHQEVDAHVRQILTGEPIDHMALMMKGTAVTARNLPAMQGEAIGADLATRAERAQQDAAWGADHKGTGSPDADWGSDSGEPLADDW